MAILQLDRTTQDQQAGPAGQPGLLRVDDEVYALDGRGDSQDGGSSPRRLRSTGLFALQDRHCEASFGHLYAAS